MYIGFNPTYILNVGSAQHQYINCLASVYNNDNSTLRLTVYEPGVLPSTRRDTAASSGMLNGYQDPLWMFTRF
jgi:hypothetical protein